MVLLGGLFSANASAQASTLYRCTDTSGVTLFTNQKTPRGKCEVMSVITPPAPKQGTNAKSGGSADPKVGGSAKNPSPADFPKVAQNEQKARDTDRRSILDNELINERNLLENARKHLAEAVKTAPSSAQALKDTVALHERNIEALNKEIAKLR